MNMQLYPLDGVTHPLDEYKIYYSEENDVRCVLFFEDNEWKLSPNELEEYNKHGVLMAYDLMKMLRKDERVGPLLDFLPKDHEYELIFQIEENHAAEIYPHLNEGEFCVKILNERKDGNLVSPSYNQTEFILEIQDVADINHLRTILERLDSIGSCYYGITLEHQMSGQIISLPSLSYIALYIILHAMDNNSLSIVESNLFELVKQQKLGIFLDIYGFNEKMKSMAKKVQDEVLRDVFEFLKTTLSTKNENKMTKNLKLLEKCPQTIQMWFKESFKNFKNDSRFSDGIVLWRKMLEMDISYNDIRAIHGLIKADIVQ